jgi:hypothetical protein
MITDLLSSDEEWTDMTHMTASENPAAVRHARLLAPLQEDATDGELVMIGGILYKKISSAPLALVRVQFSADELPAVMQHQTSPEMASLQPDPRQQETSLNNPPPESGLKGSPSLGERTVLEALASQQESSSPTAAQLRAPPLPTDSNELTSPAHQARSLVPPWRVVSGGANFWA